VRSTADGGVIGQVPTLTLYSISELAIRQHNSAALCSGEQLLYPARAEDGATFEPSCYAVGVPTAVGGVDGAAAVVVVLGADSHAVLLAPSSQQQWPDDAIALLAHFYGVPRGNGDDADADADFLRTLFVRPVQYL
jgi:hypothetical protein